MKNTFSRYCLRKKTNRFSNQLQMVSKNPFFSLGALVALGTGLSFFMNGKPGKSSPEPPLLPEKQKSYFDAAPRAISGSHRGLHTVAESKPGMVKKGLPLLIGSAAILAMYLIGKKR